MLKPLDPEQVLVTRENLFQDPVALAEEMDRVDSYVLYHNTTFDGLRSLVKPRRGD
ncbi:MAG: hypothetical protein KDI36_18035 [Pseudomonadales bacterium]|nr:hypothetical protein [Pseudomonadales bacterium]